MKKFWLVPMMIAFNAVACLIAQDGYGQSVTVDEAKIGFHLFPDPGVSVPLFLNASHAIQGTLLVEMLGNESNVVVGQHGRDLAIVPGNQVVALVWDLDSLPTTSPTFLSAYRLRYTLKPAQAGTFRPVQGIVQMGPHMVDGFSIEGYPSGEFQCAPDCRFLVRVQEPNSARALAGYTVNAKFYSDHETTVATTTDQDGYAEIHCDVPGDPELDDVGIDVMVSRGAFSTGWGGQIFRRRPPHLALTTDKLSYQPGETVRMQMTLRGMDWKPWAGGHVSLEFTDIYAEKELFRQKLVTSQSGEASAAWTVPENLDRAYLAILAVSDDEPQNNWKAQSKVKIQIERPRKPKFILKAVPDRPYYLPGETAKLTVSATDLSGNPIRYGRVSVEEGDPATETHGDLDDSGKFVARIDLKNIWGDLKDWPSPGFPAACSRDASVSISVTDNSTGETESSGAVLPLTRQTIHLYIGDVLIKAGSEKTLAIVSSYVDKSPASVGGTVEATIPDDDGVCKPSPDAAHRFQLGTFHTNGFGVARFTLPRTWINYAYPKREDAAYSRYSRVPRLDTTNQDATRSACILLRASDGKGKTGTLYERVLVEPEEHFATRIATDHAVYRPEQPIQVKVESDAGLTEALVEIRTAVQELVGAQHIRLTNGQATITFPYDPRFRGLLMVYVYAVTGLNDTGTDNSWTQEIIYPTGESLTAGARWPGDLWSPDEVEPDNPGVIFIDGENEGGWIAGIDKADLFHLDPTKPFPEGMDLLAWALLGPPQLWGGWSDGYENFNHEAFDKDNLAWVELALKSQYGKTGHHPQTTAELVDALKGAGIDFNALRDAWGMPYRALFGPNGVDLVSNGPDKIPNTSDDYRYQEVR